MKQKRRTFFKQISSIGFGSGLFAFHLPELQKASKLDLKPISPKVLDLQSDFKIQQIETFTGINQTIVKVTIDNGKSGFGQVANYANDITATVLHRMLAPHYMGRDPYQTEALTQRAIEKNYKYPWSFVCRAAAGIETALWDLRGKLEQKPVCELLGGSPKDIPAYGSSMRRDIQPKDEGIRLARLRGEEGFKAFKIRVGKVNGHDEDQWPGRTEEIIPEVRKAVGSDIALLADGNSCYTPTKAIEVGKMMQDSGYAQFEEPCPFWELEWTAEVTAALEMAVSGGEQDNDLAQWRRMIKMKAVDIAQPDICYLGGISRTIRVAEMAAQAKIPCIPHSANLSLITIFTLHLMAAIENAGAYFEYSIENPSWLKGLYEPVLRVKDGKVACPSEPGWGIQIKEDWLEKAAYQKSEV